MKKVLIVAGALLVVGLVAALSFWGGVAYQTSRVEQIRADFINSRSQGSRGQGVPGTQDAPGGQGFPGGGSGTAQPGGFSRGGTNGQVKSIAGNVLTVSTAQSVVTVNLSSDTRIQKYAAGAIADLQPGMRVMVTGQRDDQGNIKASQVLILNADSPSPGNPPGNAPAP